MDSGEADVPYRSTRNSVIRQSKLTPIVLGPTKDIPSYQIAACGWVAVLVLGILSVNLMAVLFGAFSAVAVNARYESWLGWKKTTRVFFHLSVIMIALFVLGAGFVLVCSVFHFYLVLIIISTAHIVVDCFLLRYVIKTENAIQGLYPTAKDEINAESTYTS